MAFTPFLSPLSLPPLPPPRTQTVFYRYIWHRVFDVEERPFVAFLEDDLSVSPDLDDYFWSLAPTLHMDPKLFSVSAHNDAGFPATSDDPSVVLRVEHFSQPGEHAVMRAVVLCSDESTLA